MSEPTTAAEITRLIWDTLRLSLHDRHGVYFTNRAALERKVQAALDTGEFPTLQEKR